MHHHHHHEEILSEEDKAFIKKKFDSELVNEVPVKLYVSGEDCQYCDIMKSLLKTFSELSNGKIKLEILELTDDVASELGVNRGPIILIGKNGEIRYTGSPLGEEGWAFIETLVVASHGNHGISHHVDELKNIKKTVRIETIITPSCPYCPYAVFLANRIAIASGGKVLSDTVEAYEFPEIAEKWHVTAVPTVVLSVEKPYSGNVFKIGVPEEEEILHAILELGNQ